MIFRKLSFSILMLFATKTALAATTADYRTVIIRIGTRYAIANQDLGGGSVDVTTCRPGGISTDNTIVEACEGHYTIIGPRVEDRLKIRFKCTGTFTMKPYDRRLYSYDTIDCKDLD